MTRKYFTLFFILFFFGISIFGQQSAKNYRNIKPARVQYGTASYYADKFEGRSTANGEIFRQEKMTAAHNTLPLGTWIRVTNLRNRKEVIVRINDRLHPKNPRIVDLSKKAAKKLGYTSQGLTKVKVEVLDADDPAVAAR